MWVRAAPEEQGQYGIGSSRKERAVETSSCFVKCDGGEELRDFNDEPLNTFDY